MDNKIFMMNVPIFEKKSKTRHKIKWKAKENKDYQTKNKKKLYFLSLEKLISFDF